MRAVYLSVSILLLALVPASQSLAVLDEPAPLPLIGYIPGIVEPSPTHAPVAETNVGIGPGAPLYINFPEESGTYICTANFVWTAGAKTYLGAAGHCFLPAGKGATHGPGADFDPAGVVVRVCVYGCSFGGQSGAMLPGNLVTLGPIAYARQHTGSDQIGEDFGIVEIPASALSLVRPSLPVWGGPVTANQANGSGQLCHYGQGVLVGESFATMARTGYGLGALADGSWTASLAINGGDSGSAIVTCGIEGVNGSEGFHGRAPLGIITHGTAVPIAGVGVPGVGWGTTVAKAQTMATQASLNIQLVIES